ncbi:MAG: SGNH/GDSL hydrolase family protein [Prevotella sp.]
MKKTFLLLTLALVLSTKMNAQQVAPFKAGDRVTFVGDSKTDGGHYHSYIWLYYMTHFPQMRLWMANCGVGGDTSESIYNRFDYDVLTKRPTVMTLAFGMNDTGYLEYNGDNPKKFAAERLAFAHKYFNKIIDEKLKKLKDVRIIMVGTAPYDQTSKFNDNIFHGKNDVIGKIVAMQDSAAKANNWEFMDCWAPMTKINIETQKTDPNFTINGQDRIHPDNDGQLVMAYLFLKAQGMAGKNIADIQINAKKKKVMKSENCTISNLQNNKGTVSFNYLAKSLPFPLDTIPRGWEYKRQQKAALRVIPQFIKEMDNEALTVKGLKGNYCLKIDDMVIDTLSADSLAKGINLATYEWTPQYQQARTIMELNEMRWETERQFRDYAWLQYNFFLKNDMLNRNDRKAVEAFHEGEKKDGWVKAKAGLYDKMIHQDCRDIMTQYMDNIVDRIYKINKPVNHVISLIPTKI